MRQSFILLCIALLSTVAALGQTSGFYGKKLFVELNGTGSLPLINNWKHFYDYYEKTGSNNLINGKDAVNGGFYGGIGIAMKQNVALSFTAGFSYFNTVGPHTLYFVDPNDNDLDPISVNHENLKIRSLTLMPVLHFTTNKSTILPAGFTHEIGFGVVRTKVMKSDYVFEGSDSYYGDQINYNGNYYDLHDFMDSVVSVNGDYIDYSQVYKGFTVMYGLKMRTPVSKQLMINYGFRYTLNVVSSGQEFGFNSNPTSYETALNYQLSDAIRSTRVLSVCSLQLGLTYVF
jgi:hypothetical protein